MQKIDVFRKVTQTKKQILLAMITLAGVVENPYSDVLISQVVTIENLFEF